MKNFYLGDICKTVLIDLPCHVEIFYFWNLSVQMSTSQLTRLKSHIIFSIFINMRSLPY